MAPNSLQSNSAMNGSASESVYESDSSAGTLQNDEECDYDVPDRQAQLLEQIKYSLENQSSQEIQLRPFKENTEEPPWADKDCSRPSVLSSERPITRYLGDDDPSQQFFVTGTATRKTRLPEQRLAFPLTEKGHANGSEKGRKIIKRVKQRHMRGMSSVDGERRNPNTIDESGMLNEDGTKEASGGEILRRVENI